MRSIGRNKTERQTNKQTLPQNNESYIPPPSLPEGSNKDKGKGKRENPVPQSISDRKLGLKLDLSESALGGKVNQNPDMRGEDNGLFMLQLG